MKILQINKFHYFHGGTESMYFNTSSMLEKHGHEVIYFSVNSSQNLSSPFSKYFINMPDLKGASIYTRFRNLFSFIYNKEAAKNIEKLLIEQKPDIAQIHLLFNGISPSILPILKKHNIPVILTLHDYRLLCPASLFLNAKKKICEKCKDGKYYNCTINKCSNGNWANSVMLTLEAYFRTKILCLDNYVDHYLCVSQFSRSKYIEFIPSIEKKSSVIYNFVKAPQGSPAPINEKKYYLYFGRLSREKGLETFLAAAEFLPDIPFVVIGDGPQKEYVLSKKYSNITYYSFCTGSELENHIKRAKYVVVPSGCYESFGLVLAEAFSLGVPVIGARIGAIPELIKTNVNGFLFEPYDVEDLVNAILHTNNLKSDEYYILCANAKRIYEENFTEERYYPQLIKMYTHLLNHE